MLEVFLFSYYNQKNKEIYKGFPCIVIEGEKDMLQDLDYGRLENEFRNVYPADGDTVVCFKGNMVLVHRGESNALHLPTYREVL